ncbi:hypothetical protein MMC18_007451 [Xylographa bjoerkii]|nr:hypothetical protein [Xylographa bjoerkii]
MEELLGQTHEDSLLTKHDLASDLHRFWDDEEASALKKQVLVVREDANDVDNDDLIACRHNLAINLHVLAGRAKTKGKLPREAAATACSSETRDRPEFKLKLNQKPNNEPRTPAIEEMKVEKSIEGKAKCVPSATNKTLSSLPIEGSSPSLHLLAGSSRFIKGTKVWFELFDIETQSFLAEDRKPMGRKVKIAILDTGIDLEHPQFSNPDIVYLEHGIPRDRVKGCKSFVTNEDADTDDCGHGTHSVALLLIIARKADIYVARIVKDHRSWLDPEVVSKAIACAADEWQVDIITMSLGWPRYYPCGEKAIDHALSRQVMLCAAAIDDGANMEVAFPANYPPVICIPSANGWGKPSDLTPIPLDVGPSFAIIGEAVRSSSAWPTSLS